MRITETYDGTKETALQFSYIEKAKEYVDQLAARLGRRPTACTAHLAVR